MGATPHRGHSCAVSDDQNRPDSRKSRQDLLDEIYLLRDIAGEREQRARDLGVQLSEKTAALSSVLGSRSWRITAPLRAVASWLRNRRAATRSSTAHARSAPVEPRPPANAVNPQGLARLRQAGHRCLFVDVTELAAHEGRTGVQRVVREILRALLATPPSGFDVEPVCAAAEGTWRYAHAVKARFTRLAPQGSELLIDVRAGDVFLGLDHSMQAVTDRAKELERWRAIGVAIWFVCNDTLPLSHPEWFPGEVAKTYKRWFGTVAGAADGIACISEATQAEVKHWIATLQPGRERVLRLGHFHLGANPDAIAAADAVFPQDQAIMDRLRGTPVFLMVGTLEPRKGHAQALEAFNELWAAGRDVALVIVGFPGWMTEVTQRRIRHHDEFGRRLFWFMDTEDAVLEYLYAHATALLAPSHGEGFGLPLVEAARHALPILCRDLPVFREVAAGFAVYFSGGDSASLAAAVVRWLDAWRHGNVVSTAAMPRLSWTESTQQLLDVVFAKPRAAPSTASR